MPPIETSRLEVSSRNAARLRWAALFVGVALTVALVPLSKVSGDQLNLLARGWLLAARGELVPYGNPLSIGGNGPGPVTSWLVGLPLMVARDFRAPIALVALTHLLALLLLDRATRDVFTPIERATFVVLFALLPWRVEASATLWNPNYLFLVGAVHLASARALAASASGTPRFWPTFAHVVALGLGAQLHPSVLLLGVLSLLLLGRGRIRFSWPAFAAGVAVVVATLLPWIVAVAAQPELLRSVSESERHGFPFRGLLLLFPLLKGISLWLRYPSLLISHESRRFDFTENFGGDIDAWLAPSTSLLFTVGGFLTVALVLAANLSFFRGRVRSLTARASGELEPRAWLESYAALALVAAVIVFAAAPSTPQGWQAIPLVHASLLPVAFASSKLVTRWGERKTVRALAAAALLLLVSDLALAAGAPSFRCAGRGTLVFPLRASSPMFDELGIQRACPWPLDRPAGWWPDVLPEE